MGFSIDEAVVNVQQGELFLYLRSDSVVVKPLRMLAISIRDGTKKSFDKS